MSRARSNDRDLTFAFDKFKSRYNRATAPLKNKLKRSFASDVLVTLAATTAVLGTRFVISDETVSQFSQSVFNSKMLINSGVAFVAASAGSAATQVFTQEGQFRRRGSLYEAHVSSARKSRIGISFAAATATLLVLGNMNTTMVSEVGNKTHHMELSPSK